MNRLDYTQLKSVYSTESLGFETTAALTGTTSIIGQDRAKDALSFGLQLRATGYNVYVCGLPGTGKTSFSKAFALAQAAKEPPPPDLCYVYNFKDPKRPKCLKLPAGMGKVLKADMEELIERLCHELPRVFGATEFESRKSDIVKAYQAKRDNILKDMTQEAWAQNFGVKTTNSGIYFMPIIEGEVISEEEFDNLPEEQKEDISKQSETVQRYAQQVMRQIRVFEKQSRKDVEELEYSMGLFAVGRQISALLDKHGQHQPVVDHLLEVKEDILENISDFLEPETEEEESIQALLPWATKGKAEDGLSKYYVNLLTDNSQLSCAPVLVDHNPTYTNLIGEVEYDNEYGNLTTDFMKIKPGILHKANGGTLILQAHDVLTNLHSWETLRRVLLTKEIVIEPLREYNTGLAVSGIKPEPIQVDVKIILVGTAYYYDILYTFDDAFQKLFKISADFDYEMPLNRQNLHALACFVKRCVDKNHLLEFDCHAVMEMAAFSGRLAESRQKLSTRFNRIEDIVIEASAWAAMDGAAVVAKAHVAKAIAQRENRYKLYEDKLTEMLENQFIMIDTCGEKVGQINGLAVMDMGEYAFAKPARITATTYVGKAGIVNIEQEAEMSGSIHDKGVQVLTGFLGQTYAQDFPLSLSCRVCFEQNYNGVDGDSASSTELYAILSSLSELPIDQGIAVTGSINQRGEIQPIGGVTYKIEGFFDLCKNRGLNGSQGVIIPVQNVNDLMLKDEVVEAVKAGQFHIYAIRHIDEGIAILTGVKAGARDARGKYPADSVHGKVQRKLKIFYKRSTLTE